MINDVNLIETNCKSCGKKLELGWDFCPFCKTKVETKRCNLCKRNINIDWTFCPYCKNEVKIEHVREYHDEANQWLKGILENNNENNLHSLEQSET